VLFWLLHFSLFIVQMSPAAMIDKIASRLSTQKLRPQSANDDSFEELEKDEVQVIDEILRTLQRHPLTELPPAPHGLSPVQVSNQMC